GPDRGRARQEPDHGRHRPVRARLGRRALDGGRGDRPGRAGTGDHPVADRTPAFARRRIVRRPAAVGDAQRVRRARDEEGIAGPADAIRSAPRYDFFSSAPPLWTATWSVLSLLISYCGSSSLQCRVYPCQSKSLTCTLVILPLTWPASEFHATWSPTLNLCAIFIPPFRAAPVPARRRCRR